MSPPGGPVRRWAGGAWVLAWLVLVLAAGLQIARTPFTADLTAFLPAHPDERQQVLVDQLERGLAARTLLVGIEGGQPAQRTAASRDLAQRLRASGLFDRVENGQTEGYADLGKWIAEQRYALSPAVAPGRFSEAGLRDAIGETVSLLGTPAGATIKPLLERDPTGETLRIGESLIPARGPRSEDGVWVARAAERAILLLVTNAAGADLDGQAAAIDRLRHEFASHEATGLQLVVSGAPLFSVDSRAQIEAEVRWLAIAGTLLAAGLLLVAFGSVRALLLAAVPVATGVLVGIAVVGSAFGSVHGITLGFGATLIGEAVDYAIYYLIQSRRAAAPAMAAGAAGATALPEPGFRAWLATGWPIVRLGLATSVCGFAALLLSDFPGLAQLGTFSVAGLLAAALTTRFLLPVLAPNGATGRGMRGLLGRAARAAMRVLPATRWAWLAAGAIGLAVLVARPGLWEGDLTSLSTVGAERIALDASLRADLTPGEGGLMLVVQGPDLETTLQRTESVTRALDALIDDGALAGFSSVTRLLPSQLTQQQRRASLPDEPTLRTALEAATRGGPLRAERLEPFVAEVQRARQAAPVTLEAARAAGAGALLDGLLLTTRSGGFAALVPLQPAGDTLKPGRLDQALAGIAGVQQLDVGGELRRLYRHYLGEALQQSLIGALAVVVLIALALRSGRRVLAVCQPLVLAVAITAGALALAGQPLGILHVVGLLFVVAVGSNYALFFDLIRSGSGVDDDTLASLLLANITTVASFALIATSGIPALASIGVVVAPGALLALVLAAAFAPRAGAAREAGPA